MGYACPVCGVPQRDGEHLAHHLAFTAMIHGDDHEAWLDEHVSDWADRDPEGLAECIVDHAAAAQYDEVFEDTVDRGRPDADRGGGSIPAIDTSGNPDPETAAAIEEARELTRRMYDGDTSEGSDEAAESAVGDDDPRS